MPGKAPEGSGSRHAGAFNGSPGGFGVAPTHTPAASAARRQGMREMRAARAVWETDHKGQFHDPAWFEREVLPGLQVVSLTQIAKATGMSTSSASQVRSGKRVPHPRHWEALMGL